MQPLLTAAPAIGFFPGVGAPELLIILFVLLLLFGAKKLPELARGMGKSIKEFKKATNEIEEDIRTAIDTPEPPPAPTPAATPAPNTQAQTQAPTPAEPAENTPPPAEENKT